jgi:transposase
MTARGELRTPTTGTRPHIPAAGARRGQKNLALACSRGGFSTKIHLKTDFDGFPIAFDLTGGEKADSSEFETPMAIGPDVTPRSIVADKGYDSRANRAAARQQSILPFIPHRSTTKTIPKAFGKALYRGRARVEQAIGKFKRFKPIALRCEEAKQNFSSFVAIAAAFISVKSVHTA